MRYLNIALVAIWGWIFFASLHPIPDTMEAEGGLNGLRSQTVILVNSWTEVYCPLCVLPAQPVVNSGNESEGYMVAQAYALPWDNRVTQTILQNTFVPFALFLAALNLGVLIGRGDVRRFAEKVIGGWHHIYQRFCEWLNRRKVKGTKSVESSQWLEWTTTNGPSSGESE